MASDQSIAIVALGPFVCQFAHSMVGEVRKPKRSVKKITCPNLIDERINPGSQSIGWVVVGKATYSENERGWGNECSAMGFIIGKLPWISVNRMGGAQQRNCVKINWRGATVSADMKEGGVGRATFN